MANAGASGGPRVFPGVREGSRGGNDDGGLGTAAKSLAGPLASGGVLSLPLAQGGRIPCGSRIREAGAHWAEVRSLPQCP